MAGEIRAYAVADCGQVMTSQQKRDLIAATRPYDFAQAIIDAAKGLNVGHYDLLAKRWSPDDSALLFRVELPRNEPLANLEGIRRAELEAAYIANGGDSGDLNDATPIKTVILAILNNQASVRSVTGNAQARYAGVLQGEFRDGAFDAGLAAVAGVLSVTVIGWGERRDAVDQANAWIALNQANWEEAVA